MAIRSSAGTGVIVSLVVFVLATVFLLVLSIVFYVQNQELKESVDNSNKKLRIYFRNEDNAGEYVVAAEDAEQSLAGYLINQIEERNKLLTGNPTETIDSIRSQFSESVSGGSPLAMTLSKMQGQIDSMNQELHSRYAELSSAQNTIDSLKLELKNQSESKEIEVQLVKNEWQEVQDHAEELNTKADEFFDSRKERLRSIYAKNEEKIVFLEKDIVEMNEEKARLMTKIYDLREKINSSSLDSVDPSLLVDGNIINVGGGNEVFINRGKNDHIVLGMTFDIYDSASQLRPNEDGNLPRGKATVEVVGVGPTTSTAKIIRSTSSQPIVRDNIIVNPVYDPNYAFSFLVHGSFDADGDGVPESNNSFIKDQITRWGGVIYEDTGVIPGDLDFLVLGIAPKAPSSKPKKDASPAVENAYNAQQADYLDYESLRQQARTAGVPVLTANRLYILTGYQGN
jgi:CHASE3 domain sensor protein